MIKYVGVEFAILLSPVNGKQGAVALTNKKLYRFDQIHADNLVKQNGVSMSRKNK
jgi:hypothetical protein